MAHIMLDASRQRAGRRAAMTLIAFVAGTALAVSAAMAQQPAAKKSPEKAPAAAAPAAAAPAKAADAGAPQSLWVKLCEQAQIYGRDKDGKETAAETITRPVLASSRSWWVRQIFLSVAVSLPSLSRP